MALNWFIILFLAGGWLSGRLFSLIRLPGILGMLLFGVAFGILSRTGFSFPEEIAQVEPFLKSLALIIILLRAGLGINKATLQKVGLPAALLAFIPCLTEGITLTFLFHLLFGFDWETSALSAFMLSAVSPAVVIPSMLELKAGGFGKRNEVPTMILAGASVDDVVAITLFSSFLAMKTGDGGLNLAASAAMIPLSIAGGIIGGIIGGFILAWVFERGYERIRATEKVIILLTFALLSVELGALTHTAALIGVMTMGFIILERSARSAGEIAAKLGKIWVLAEIVLFVLIGMQVDVTVALGSGVRGILLITLGLAGRSIGTFAATLPDRRLSFRERIFCVIAYLPKATVQAALGSVPLAAGIPEGQVILSVAVLAIIVTAPLGLLLIRGFGSRLLDAESLQEASA